MAANVIKAQIQAYQDAQVDAAGLEDPFPRGGGYSRASSHGGVASSPSRVTRLTTSVAPPAGSGAGAFDVRSRSRQVQSVALRDSRAATDNTGYMKPESAKDLARQQAVRGRWRPAKSCSGMFTGKTSIFAPTSPHLRRWDLLMAVLLVYTAVVTPFEVAFLVTKIDFLFVVNRLVDLCFILDMFVNFLAPYQGSGKEEGQWIFKPRKIAINYLKTWFVIDLLSILPFDLVGLVTQSDQIQKLSVLRAVRLFRLLKLLRVLRSKRIMKRWETLIDFNYKLVSLVKFATMMLFFSHWMSCVWMLSANVTKACPNLCPNEDDDLQPDLTWVDNVGLVGATPLDLYAACLYWSVMTLSTIGYGDIAPANNVELTVGIFCMLGGASLWAYVVGNVCGVVASLDVRTLAFRQVMDDLNFFMSEKKLPQELRRRLREYFHQAKHMHQTGNYEGLLRKLSPKLRGEVALATNRDWVSKVYYFKYIRDDCLSAIAVNLRASVYAPQELITGNELHIVMRGVAGQQGRIITRGNVWGEDMILEARHLAHSKPVRALTYLDVYALSRQQLFDILDDYPATRKKIQRVALMLALVRQAGLIRRARKREAQKQSTSPTGGGGDGGEGGGAGAGSAVAMVQHNDDDENVVKDVLHGGTNADVARVEARVQRNVESIVADQVLAMEQRFAALTQKLEQKLLRLQQQ